MRRVNLNLSTYSKYIADHAEGTLKLKRVVEILLCSCGGEMKYEQQVFNVTPARFVNRCELCNKSYTTDEPFPRCL
jgi:hypothetical protein